MTARSFFWVLKNNGTRRGRGEQTGFRGGSIKDGLLVLNPYGWLRGIYYIYNHWCVTTVGSMVPNGRLFVPERVRSP